MAKDPDKPFIISAGDVHVQVLGTKFNLRAYENIETVEVALVEGSVLFKTPTHPNEILKKGLSGSFATSAKSSPLTKISLLSSVKSEG